VRRRHMLCYTGVRDELELMGEGGLGANAPGRV
jgi:hypothetical protein